MQTVPLSSDFDYQISIALIGDVDVGKTSLMRRFTADKFDQTFTTIGVDSMKRDVIIDGKKVEVKVWDTAGQERFRTLTSNYYRGVHGVLVIYDISSEQTFAHVENWILELKNFANENTNIMLVGNKMDIVCREVIPERGRSLAGAKAIEFMEASAKTSENVDDLFLHFIQEIIERLKNENTADDLGIVDIKNVINPPSKKCPC